MTYRTLGFPSTELPMQAILSIALPLTATQKVVIQKWPTQLTLLCVKALSLQTSVISYLRVLRVRNNICKHSKCGFTPFVVAVTV